MSGLNKSMKHNSMIKHDATAHAIQNLGEKIESAKNAIKAALEQYEKRPPQQEQLKVPKLQWASQTLLHHCPQSI